MITSKDIIFAGLMGSQSVGTIKRAGVVQNELQKHVLPTIPFLPVDDFDTSVSSKKYSVNR